MLVAFLLFFNSLQWLFSVNIACVTSLLNLSSRCELNHSFESLFTILFHNGLRSYCLNSHLTHLLRIRFSSAVMKPSLYYLSLRDFDLSSQGNLLVFFLADDFASFKFRI